MADLLRAEFLRNRRRGDIRIHFLFFKESHRFAIGMRHNSHIFAGVKPDIGHDRREEDVPGGAQGEHGHAPALQVPNRADRLVREQLEATNMAAGENHQGGALIQAQEEWPEEEHPHLGVAGDQGPVRSRRLPDELYIGKPLSLEEGFHNILRGLTDARGPGQPERGRFRGWLSGDWSGAQAKQPCGPCERQPTQEPPPAALSSVLRIHRNLPSKLVVSVIPSTPANGLFFRRANRRST